MFIVSSNAAWKPPKGNFVYLEAIPVNFYLESMTFMAATFKAQRVIHKTSWDNIFSPLTKGSERQKEKNTERRKPDCQFCLHWSSFFEIDRECEWVEARREETAWEQSWTPSWTVKTKPHKLNLDQLPPMFSGACTISKQAVIRYPWAIGANPAFIYGMDYFMSATSFFQKPNVSVFLFQFQA